MKARYLVVNLAKGRLGADVANVLGGMVVSTLSLAAYSRQNIPETERRPFFLYIDEFHTFTTSAFAGMLSEMRKYNFSLIIAQQHSSQIEKNVLEAILGNVGTLIVFRVGATDAAMLTKQFGSEVPQSCDLVSLTNFELFAKLMIDGQQSQTFSAKTC